MYSKTTLFPFLAFIIIHLGACSQVFFIPDKRLIRTPSTINLGYQELEINAEPGVVLNGWLLKGKAPVKGTVVFLHGNAQNISYHIASVHWLPKEHYNVLLYDYRGFGKSTGKSNINNAIQDLPKVMEKLEETLPEAERKYVLFGQSLGGALSIAAFPNLAQQFDLRGLMADSAFSGFRDIAQEKVAGIFWLWPLYPAVSVTIPDQPDLLESIALTSPADVLLIHGAKDQIIPLKHADLLYSRAREPKELWIEPEAGHIAALASPLLRNRILDFLNQQFKTASEQHMP